MERLSLHSLLQEQKTKAFLSEGLYFFSSGKITGERSIGIRGSSFFLSPFVIEGRRIYRVKNERSVRSSKKSIKRIILRITLLPPD